MSRPPDQLRIYHITHMDNLPAIVREGRLVCDTEMVRRGGPARAIGLSEIKRRRIEELEVGSHPETHVGDYVPFYFCPRSIMLYVIYKANHPELTFRGGEGEIVHLELDLREVVDWADREGIRWAFSLSNAGAYYAEFRTGLDALEELDWQAITATDFRAANIKEGKQAEFLVHGTVSWGLVRRIGVRTIELRDRVAELVSDAPHQPAIEVRPDWYYSGGAGR